VIVLHAGALYIQVFPLNPTTINVIAARVKNDFTKFMSSPLFFLALHTDFSRNARMIASINPK